MPLTFFEEKQSIQLDFAADYLKAHPKEHGKSHEVKQVRLTNSGTGYMVYTDVCTGFFYRKETVLQQLLEALQVYVEGQDGYAIYMHLNTHVKKGFQLGVDLEAKRNWFGSGKKYSHVEEIGSELGTTQQNPFLKNLTWEGSKEKGREDSVDTTSKGGTVSKK